MKTSDKHAQLHVFAFFVCFTFCFFLLYKIMLAPCIYGWRARHNIGGCWRLESLDMNECIMNGCFKLQGGGGAITKASGLEG